MTPLAVPVLQLVLGLVLLVAGADLLVRGASLPVFMSGYHIARWEGALFLTYYLAYVLYLLLEASSQEALGALAAVMRQVVIPLTVATLAITLVRALKMRTATHRQPESNPP